ncbi:aminotransferase class IV [Bilifractor sp. HCP3S3_D3]|uniref:aminotransferase class IV n=1 Tax=unclassified Bilifractor TaxID=2815795 RepID=UPI003F8CA61F
MEEIRCKADDGFFFGMGLFETIAIIHGTAMLEDLHIRRLAGGLRDLHIENRAYLKWEEEHGSGEERGRGEWCGNGRKSGMETWLTEMLHEYLSGLEKGRVWERGALKITVTEENLLFSTRENPYTDRQFQEGLRLRFSPVLRNETSPFTYYKTLNCGDNILVHRQIQKMGYDEAVFVNTKGEICEGSVSNVFFTRGNEVVTPPVTSGLLKGTIRSYLLDPGKKWMLDRKEGDCLKFREQVVRTEDLKKFTGMFITNSLMGIMPVQSLGRFRFPDRKAAEALRDSFLRDMETGGHNVETGGRSMGTGRLDMESVSRRG